MNNIDNQNTYYLPNTLDGINLISESVSTNALLVDGTNMMLADINMNNHNIKNLNAGITNDEAVNVSQLNGKADIAYVNANFLNKVTTSAQTVAGNINMGANKITTTYTPVNNPDLCNKLYVNSQDSLKVSKSGDSMTGTLDMIGNKIITFYTPVDPYDLCNKAYVNSQDNLRALDSTVVHNTMIETIAGVKTFTSSPIVPTATTATQAINLGNLTTALVPYAVDANVVHNTGAETIAGVKTFTASPIVPTATTSGQSANLGNINSALTPYALDANVVHKTGAETIAGEKTFTSRQMINVNSAQGGSSHLELNNNLYWIRFFTNLSGGNYNGAVSAGDSAIIFTQNNPTANPATGTLHIGPHDSTGASGIKISPSLNTSYKPLSLNGQKIQSLANGTIASDAVNYSQLTGIDSNAVHKTGDETIAGIKTFSSSPIVPNATTSNQATAYGQLAGVDANAVHITGDETIAGIKTFSSNPVVPTATLTNQAVNKGQMDTEFSSRERTRPQAPRCLAWRKMGGVDVPITTMAVGWTADALAPVATSSVWGLEHTLVNDGVFVRTDMVLYKGDTVNGFYFGCKAPDDNGSVVKIFVYDDTDNTVVVTQPSTCANQYVVYCPLLTPWVIPRTQTFKICIVWQSGGVNHILTCISPWVIFFNTMSASYNNQYINQINKSPPTFYDLTDVTLGRTPIIYAYRQIA